MKIQITKELIKNGKSCDSNYCPIALAIKDLYNCDGIEVHPHVIFIIKEFKMYKHFTTEFVKKWIEDFDNGLNVEPFEFNLSLRRKYEKFKKNI